VEFARLKSLMSKMQPQRHQITSPSAKRHILIEMPEAFSPLIKPDGSKAPAVFSWKAPARHLPTDTELQN